MNILPFESFTDPEKIATDVLDHDFSPWSEAPTWECSSTCSGHMIGPIKNGALYILTLTDSRVNSMQYHGYAMVIPWL